MRFLGGVGEGVASGCHRSTFVALEAESLLDVLFSLFRGEFLREFDYVNIYGIEVFGSSGGQGDGLEGLSRPSTSLSNLLNTIPLILEVSHLRVPVVNFIWDCVEGHDPLHEQGGDSSGKETNQDVVVHDSSTSGVTLECQDVTLKRRGELPILLNHMVGGQPGDGIPSSILMFEGLLELLKKVVPGSEGDGGAVDGIFSEGISPDQGGPFGHVQESKGDFLHIIVVGGLIDCKIKLDGVHPQDGCFIEAVEGFGFAKLEFSRFDGGVQHGVRDRWAGVGWW